MKRRRTTSADIDNIITEDFLYNRFKLLAVNMFKYEGLDDLNIEERHIENLLFDLGDNIWFTDPDYGLMCLKGMGKGCNVYDEPTSYIVSGFNYSKEIPADQCVRMENNKLRMPTADVVKYFVNQLYEVVRTRDTNVKTLKLPFMMWTNDTKVLTAKELINQINNNAYVVVADPRIIEKDSLQVIQTGAKPFTNELTDLYHDILNEALTYLGINNANTDKRERLNGDEVNANNQLIECCAQMFLESRQRAVEKINKMFGTNISVELRKPIIEGGEGYEIEPVSEHTTSDEQPND